MTVTLSLWSEAPYFFVNGDIPAEAVDTIESELSYRVPDAEYTDAWKSGDWDGFNRLFRSSESGNRYFPIGCLSTVTQILDIYSVEYEIEGLERPGRGEMSYEWNSEFDLREYQEEAVKSMIKKGCGVVVMPTGAGKTVVGIRAIYELRRSALVLVHRTEIADQWAERLEKNLGVDVARYYGGDHENGDVQVGLYQSLYDPGERGIRADARTDHDILMCDETHRVAADTFSAVAMDCTAPYRFGLTATPEREDNATLEIIGGTGPVVANLSVARLISDGYLAEPEWELYDAPPSDGRSTYRQWQDEYQREIVENDNRNGLIADVVAELEPPTLVTVERVNHGERLQSLIPDSQFVHGSDADREAKIDDFRDGGIGRLIATRGIVGEGFDVPSIRSFVVAGGLKSSTSMIQQVGRALRPGESGKATIVDFRDRGRWIGEHSQERIDTYQEYYGEYGPC